MMKYKENIRKTDKFIMILMFYTTNILFSIDLFGFYI